MSIEDADNHFFIFKVNTIETVKLYCKKRCEMLFLFCDNLQLSKIILYLMWCIT